MKSIFTEDGYTDAKARIASLNPTTMPVWGKMNVGQMLHHCQKPFALMLGKETVKVPFMAKVMSRFYKPLLYNDKPLKQGLPTAKEFVVKDDRDFEKEKNVLLALMDEVHELKKQDKFAPHPIFGSFTKQQWGQMQYKHLDHHLRQFGV
ncbi:DUF1569 domain-containing protein [Galbibacter mesophilus]|uniref:DUF1569 domain-containing protein n=1 Tax=Galbibacter mesophilus TaxID=379069 RepID=UPI00191DE903|nr:DUF1569 domain-containing protein [Galbibacter mesophilus]MCM5661750.1 DUF1569 domain-containing protein [Galbibacter mesophilus]